MGKVCKKCGYARKPQDAAPAYACPNCGAVYEKVEAQLARQATGDGAPKNLPGARRINRKAGPAFRRGSHLLLLLVSWVLGLAGIVNLLAGDFKLAILTLPALIVALPASRKLLPSVVQVSLIGLLITGLTVNNLIDAIQETERLEKEAAERQDRREEYAKRRAERIADFESKKQALLSEARLNLSDGNFGAVLAVTTEWADLKDKELVELEREALRSAKEELANGNFAFLSGFNNSDFPQFALLNEEAQRLRAAAEARAEAEACKKDLQCWGDKHTVMAGFRCDNHVERLAKYAFEWTDGFLEPKFSRFRWKSKESGVITYIGDKIRFQNGFGAWQNYVYECDLDPISEVVHDVRASPGRL
ncbi:hypothetical protein Thi970DRAFT_04520 [Thiorhodovibrio frisius]|uniref:Uncharacterized protein n=1 Tax=Thiorhodovibrio frisius TaxID=631362 RepID=H8Z754_9GAMM|nr:hypothetical protein Thi970DRAFT_04520 [Thiorhodovibrio frisius]WPL21906.1 hypothetical protein Thiofri_02043 [Thiorhodovibrio frisius]